MIIYYMFGTTAAERTKNVYRWVDEVVKRALNVRSAGAFQAVDLNGKKLKGKYQGMKCGQVCLLTLVSD